MGTIAGVVLASGMSRRFAGANKLLLPVDQEPVARRTVRAYLDADLDPVLVVVGYEAESVSRCLDGLSVDIVSNPDFALGQSRALIRGVSALPDKTEAAVIGVADQPFLTSTIIRDLVDKYQMTRAVLVIARYAGQRGNPVLFHRTLFSELLEVAGDQGGRSVLERHLTDAVWIDAEDAAAGADVDTPDQYEYLRRETGGQL